MADYKHLMPDPYEVCWNKGTGHPFSGRYERTTDKDMYKCVCFSTNSISVSFEKGDTYER